MYWYVLISKLTVVPIYTYHFVFGLCEKTDVPAHLAATFVWEFCPSLHHQLQQAGLLDFFWISDTSSKSSPWVASPTLMSWWWYLSNFVFMVDFSLRDLLCRKRRVAGDKYFQRHLDDGSARFALRDGVTEACLLNIFRRYLERALHFPHISSCWSRGVI